MLITFDRGQPYYPLDHRVSLNQLDIPSYSRPRTRAFLSAYHRTTGLRRAIRGHNPDLVISFLGKINMLTVMATRAMGVPVVVSERNNPDRQIFRSEWRFLREYLYRRADRVVAPSQGVLNWFSEATRSKGIVIPNPVDIPTEIPPRKPEGSPCLIAVGRLAEQKGFDILLSSFAKIANDFPDWKLVIRGEGEERSRLEHLRDDLGLGDRVALPGITEQPGAWIEEGDVFVLSSRYEGFGNVLTEAMVAAMPIVSFDCPWGPGEILTNEEDGLLVKPEDPDALAASLARVMRDSALRKRLGATARRNVARFDRNLVLGQWDRMVEGVLDQKVIPWVNAGTPTQESIS